MANVRERGQHYQLLWGTEEDKEGGGGKEMGEIMQGDGGHQNEEGVRLFGR